MYTHLYSSLFHHKNEETDQQKIAAANNFIDKINEHGSGRSWSAKNEKQQEEKTYEPKQQPQHQKNNRKGYVGKRGIDFYIF